MAHTHVPKFGNWEDDGNVPYTQYFENARRGRGGKVINNPNDPDENPDSFSDDIPVRTESDPQAAKDKHERQASGDDSDLHQRSYGYSLHNEAIARRPVSASPQHRHGRTTAADHSVERSPLHPHHHVKAASKGGISSPSWERKGSSEGSHGLAPHTPSRSRMRPSRGDETSDRGSTVPKFGDWDESDPSSADGYTHIFNKVREEKQSGSAKVPMVTDDAAYMNNYHQDRRSNSTGCLCFGWGKK